MRNVQQSYYYWQLSHDKDKKMTPMSGNLMDYFLAPWLEIWTARAMTLTGCCGSWRVSAPGDRGERRDLPELPMCHLFPPVKLVAIGGKYKSSLNLSEVFVNNR